MAEIRGARVIAVLGDSVTTDHISPAGSIKKDSPAGTLPVGAGGRAGRLQLLRLPARQSRGAGARHLRQHPDPEPAGAEHRGRSHHLSPDRRGDADLRCGDALPGRRHPAAGARGQGVRLGLESRLGGQGPGTAGDPRGHRRELRANPPLEPGGDGHPAAAVRAGESADTLGLTGRESSTSRAWPRRSPRIRRRPHPRSAGAEGGRRTRSLSARPSGSTRRRRCSTTSTAGSFRTCCGSCSRAGRSRGPSAAPPSTAASHRLHQPARRKWTRARSSRSRRAIHRRTERR